MAGRLGFGPGGMVGTSQTSTRPANPGSIYGPKVRNGMGSMAVHHWLWVLVAIELGLLVLLRYSFRHYHAG